MAEHVACAYCGLPVAADDHGGDARFCCFGCRFAASIDRFSGEAETSGAQLRLGLAIFFAMNVMVFTMFLWSQPEQVSDTTAALFYDVARYLCLLFSIPVVLLLGPGLINDAIANLRQRRLSASTLLVIGVAAALAYSGWSVFRGTGHVYFEVGVMVLVLSTLGRWMEAEGKLRTTRALRELQELLPATARRVRPGGIESIAIAEVALGEEVLLLPGERVALDGVIVRGRATLDEQTITGESIPVEKDPGQAVYSGTFNLDGELVVRTTSTASAGTFQKLLDAVLAAASSRNRYQRLADRAAAWLLPAVTFVGLVTFAMSVVGSNGFDVALLRALAVVVIACPCALGLATPMALWAAVGRAANMQILLRNGDALAQLAKARTVCFDKTGTLTTGQLSVVGQWFAPGADQAEVDCLAAALGERSRHPIATALVTWLEPEAQTLLCDVRETAGRGLSACSVTSGAHVLLGSWRWMVENACDAAAWQQAAESQAWQQRALAFLAVGGRIITVFALDDALRPDAAATVAALRKRGLRVLLLTGDRRERAVTFADKLDLECEAELLPEQKLARITELARTAGPVVMVGDGLNDAPALAAADVGIALGSAADLSRHAAAVCMLGNRLERIPALLDLARDANRTLQWNLFWAFAYNLAAIPLASLGLVNPIIAALAMAFSSALVVSNSLKLAVGPGGSSDGAESLHLHGLSMLAPREVAST
jgi:heavy metal translocating P-type ATPase